VFDQRRVRPSGLAGEIVLPPLPSGDPARQFSRTPYAVGFRAGREHFVLVTAHILYGQPAERTPEITALATHVAREMRDRVGDALTEEENLIVLGDFNVDKRSDDPNFLAFVSTGLWVPPQLEHLRTATGSVPSSRPDRVVPAGFRPGLRRSRRSDRFRRRRLPELTGRNDLSRVGSFPALGGVPLDRSAQHMAPALGSIRHA
jgi:hypothetical protein